MFRSRKETGKWISQKMLDNSDADQCLSLVENDFGQSLVRPVMPFGSDETNHEKMKTNRCQLEFRHVTRAGDIYESRAVYESGEKEILYNNRNQKSSNKCWYFGLILVVVFLIWLMWSFMNYRRKL